MILVDVEQGSDAWRAARAGLLTASCFGTIFAKGRNGEESLTKEKLGVRLALERVNGRPMDSIETWAMRQGKEREPLARAAYEIETGNLVQQVGFCRHDSLAAGCSPDSLIGSDGGLEIKSPQWLAHLATLRTRRVPPEYVWQVHGCMWITARRWWDFVSWNPEFPERHQLVIVRVLRDAAAIERLRIEAAVFLQEVDAIERELRA